MARRGRGRSTGNSFNNFYRSLNRPVSRIGRTNISLLHVILIVLALYFVFRILLPLVWILFLVLLVFSIMKYIVRTF